MYNVYNIPYNILYNCTLVFFKTIKYTQVFLFFLDIFRGLRLDMTLLNPFQKHILNVPLKL